MEGLESWDRRVWERDMGGGIEGGEEYPGGLCTRFFLEVGGIHGMLKERMHSPPWIRRWTGRPWHSCIMGRQKTILDKLARSFQIRHMLLRQALAECLGTLILVVSRGRSLAWTGIPERHHVDSPVSTVIDKSGRCEFVWKTFFAEGLYLQTMAILLSVYTLTIFSFWKAHTGVNVCNKSVYALLCCIWEHKWMPIFFFLHQKIKVFVIILHPAIHLFWWREKTVISSI